jgi:hypothetical protein
LTTVINFSGNVAKVGKQQDPVPDVHNSGWMRLGVKSAGNDDLGRSAAEKN